MKYSDHARRVAMAGAIGTIAGLLLWAGRSGTGDAVDRLIIAGIFALPIVFAFAGLLRRRVYTAAWTAMLAVVYMGYTLAEYTISGGTPGLWLTLVATSLLFAGSTLYTRLRSREGTARKPSG